MATLKEHQNAMVDLLANGSAIPASAARLAHALHDVLGLLIARDSEPHSSFVGGPTATASHNDACSHSWAALTNAHTLECIHCGVKKSDVAISELAKVISQRDTYKARCESLEAEVAKRATQTSDAIEALRAQREANDQLKERLEDAEEKLGW